MRRVTQRYDISNRNPTPRSRKSLSSLSTELRGRNGDTAEEGAEGRTERGVPCCETATGPAPVRGPANRAPPRSEQPANEREPLFSFLAPVLSSCRGSDRCVGASHWPASRRLTCPRANPQHRDARLCGRQPRGVRGERRASPHHHANDGRDRSAAVSPPRPAEP